MLIIIQSRRNSERFPVKVMANLGGMPVLQHVISNCYNAANLAKGINLDVKLIVAIPHKDPLKKWLHERFIPYFEGSENNVLERYLHCARTHRTDHVVRITGDCPFIDPAIIYLVMHLGVKYDFFHYTQIDGQEVEVISYRCLEWAHSNASTPEDQEHVTTYIKKNFDSFAGFKFTYGEYKSRMLKGWIPKLSVDTKEDLEKLNKIYSEWRKL